MNRSPDKIIALIFLLRSRCR
ncbi:protein MgtR [Salmonella enterica]|nr:protein MgtR [Salmonella enterica]